MAPVSDICETPFHLKINKIEFFQFNAVGLETVLNSVYLHLLIYWKSTLKWRFCLLYDKLLNYNISHTKVFKLDTIFMCDWMLLMLVNCFCNVVNRWKYSKPYLVNCIGFSPSLTSSMRMKFERMQNLSPEFAG